MKLKHYRHRRNQQRTPEPTRSRLVNLDNGVESPSPSPSSASAGNDCYQTAPLKGFANSALPWEGCISRKPWEYRITATLAVIDPGDSLDIVIELLRAQTERPYIIIVDTGSKFENLLHLYHRFYADEDVEIHALRSRAWRHSSAPVGAALDLALAACHSAFLYATHDDVFLKRRDYLANLLAIQQQEQSIAVGYEMSSREWLTDQWSGMVSHTATLFHVPTLLRIGASWSFERAHFQFDVSRSTQGWPDTETAFGLLLKSLGIKPVLIGHETNFERFEDENLIHCRSHTGSKLYSPEHHRRSSEWILGAIADSQKRLSDWREIL